MKRNFFAVTFTIGLVALLTLTISEAVDAKEIAPPDQPGPFNVGTTTFSATMSGGRVTRVQVYYPTLEPSDPLSLYTISYGAGGYVLQSPLGAVQDAPGLPGFFPLVVHDHGSGAPGADFQRVSQLPLHELMATHGFVTVVALHSPNPVARVIDLSLLIDVLLARSADPADLLYQSVDSSRIGISGLSAGGASAVLATSGWSDNGIVPEARIKAAVFYEPAPLSLADAASIQVPYLVMGGLQSRAGQALPTLFDATVNASPRFYVVSPSATHFSFLTGMGAEIDQTREQALWDDPTLPEPLTVQTLSHPAAARAYELWNMGEPLLFILGPGAGSGRNFCDRVGVASIRSLDLNGDGFTDSPPFRAIDPPYLARPAIREEVMVPLIKLYTIAFWKSYLEGDHRYMRYLTPGYAERNDLEASVFIGD